MIDSVCVLGRLGSPSEWNEGMDCMGSSLNRGTVHSVAVKVRGVGRAVIVATHAGVN